MLYLLFPLLFRITPQNINRIPGSHKKNIKLDRCWENLSNDKFTKPDYDEYVVYCHNGLQPSVFKMTSTRTVGVSSSNSNSKVFKIRNVECTFNENPFINCVFQDSLINFEGTNNNYIANSNSISNCSNGSGPSSANIMYINAKTTTIQDNTITFTSVDKACRTFRIFNNEKTILMGNQITNANINTDSSENGIGAYISGTNTANPVTISGCTFTTCGKTGGLYVVIFNVPKFEFTFNKITFSDSLTSCGCVSSIRSTELVYTNNVFENARYNSNNWRSAGIDQNECTSSQETLTVENNTFNNIKGNNQGRCIYLKINNPASTSFRENTFQNCPSGSFFIKIAFISLINEMIIDSCKFIENALNKQWVIDPFSSCNQIIIQNKLDNDCSLPYLLTLENCLFEGNTSPLKGGGFHYGFNRYASNTIVHLINCQFKKNQASETGGALAIQSYQGFLIENCTFTENTATQGGGAIYIETDFFCHRTITPSGTKEDESIIRGCTFVGNTGSEAHGIFIQSVSTTSIQILSCKFTDCGTNDYVIVDPNNDIQNDIENCTFEYSNEEQSSSAISTKSTNIHLIGNTFRKCNSNTVHLNSSTDISSFELIENTFYYCHRGTIIRTDSNTFIQAHTIKGNTFEDVQLTTTPSMYLELSSESLLFNNNTFKSFNMNADQGGIGLEINRKNKDLLKVSFEACYFIGNSNKNNYQAGGLRIDYYQNNGKTSLKVMNCVFERNSNNKGAGLMFCVNSEVTIEETIFRGNTGSEGSSIYVKPNYDTTASSAGITIYKCTFENNPSSSKSSIFCEPGTTKSIRIDTCTFKEEQGGIHVQNLGNNPLTIVKTDFIHITTRSSIIISQTTAITALTIDECTFDGCSGGVNKCFDIVTHAPTFTFSNNVINNCKLSGNANYCGNINMNNKIATFELTNITFYNNTSNSAFGGGSSIQISGTNEIIFSECHFNNNHVFRDSSYNPSAASGPNLNGFGGGLQIGNCGMMSIGIIIRGCIFENNEAELNGGGLSIEKYVSNNDAEGFLIENCEFKSNVAGQKGGSIYVGSETPCGTSITSTNENGAIIRNCTFEGNTGNEAHGIFIQSVSTTSIQILSCKFTDCGTNNYVIVDPNNDIQNDIENCTFEYSNEEQSSSAISTRSTNIHLIGNTFRKCNSNTVHLNSSTDISSFELIENTFYYCHRGTIIRTDSNTFIQAHTIKGNTFEDVQLTTTPSMYLELSSESLLFNNNTFKSFNMNADQGGIGLEINRKNKDLLKVSFEACYFIGNSNKNNYQAGGLRIDYYQNNGKTSLKVMNCVFERNSNNKGAGLMFCVNSEVTIEETIFRGNTGSEGSSIYVKPNYDTTASSAEITIYKCTFENNPSSSKSSIFCEPGTTKSIRIDTCTFKEEQGGIHVQNLGNNQLTFVKTDFIHITTRSSIIISQTTAITTLTIDECTFDGCSGGVNKCFDIVTHAPTFTFSNNVIQNNQPTGCNNYIATINLNNKISSFELTNITFLNNTSNSLYGGGSSLIVLGTNQITFNQCHFTNNRAFQDQSVGRPTSGNEPYYNGDGGALQIGYWCKTNDVDISITNCDFNGNQAKRHGGALSIQTLKTVTIESCQFNNNIANCNFETASNLVILEENHFHLKSSGRGGGIYINPTYYYSKDGLSCPTTTSVAMASFVVRSSTFTSNNACDGYAMYIEGDDSGTSFQINGNTFHDNYNESNHVISPNDIFGAVVTSEIVFQKDTIVKSNTWTYSNNQLHVNEVNFVDHFGNTATFAFTMSDYFPSSNFTLSNFFTQSNHFSNSGLFTKSDAFSKSRDFTKSNDFSHSKYFSKSNSFTNSDDFTKSKGFTKSNLFSDSKEFTNSNVFSGTNQFSNSAAFSGTERFTETGAFSSSNKFSKSESFSDSKEFSHSNAFSRSDKFSNSAAFSGTERFTETGAFSSSNKFSKSESFSDSKEFSHSNAFSRSDKFSNSAAFSGTEKFTETGSFSISSKFSKSESFSDSKEFSQSNAFSNSAQFTNSEVFSSSRKFSYSELFTISSLFTQSSSFSDSKAFSKSEVFSRSKQFSNSQLFSETNQFSATDLFSISNKFSKSELFSKSAQFSDSNKFSESLKFSKSQSFTETEKFTLTSDFSKSNKFSESNDFTLSKEFSPSDKFSHSNYFSSSNLFSKTEGFSLTTDFTLSGKFSLSTKFTESIKFSFSKEFSFSKHFSLTDMFSYSTKFTNSVSFTLSTKFTESNDFTQSKEFDPTPFFSQSGKFTKTEGFTFTGAFSKSTKFTFSNEFSISNKFTQTYHFSLTDRFTNTEKFSLTNSFSYSTKFSNSHQFSESERFTESYGFSPSITLEPNDPSCIVEDEEGNITYSDRCDYSDFNGKNVTVLIVRSNFTNFVEDSNGGAIHIANCSFRCNGTEFIDCASINGGGGGIYINNTIEHEKTVDLINLVFIRCKAFYGGAVFIQSNYELNSILIKSCIFRSNEAYPRRTNEGSLFGGSSVYLIADDADVINDTFVGNKGPGGCFKIISPHDKHKGNLVQLEENEKLSIKIDGCEFDQSESIYYESRENGGSEVEINDCNFKGKLIKGSHYINGKILLYNSPKLLINSCQFEHEINESIKHGLVKKISSVKIMKEISLNENLKSQKVENNKNVLIVLCSFAIFISVVSILMMKFNHHFTNNDSFTDNLDNNFESNNLNFQTEDDI